MKPTKKTGNMRREDVIFDLAWKLRNKHYPDLDVGEFKRMVIQLLNEDRELQALLQERAPTWWSNDN